MSTLLNPEAVSDKLRKEISKVRVVGPIRGKPFRDKFKCSPLAIQVKTIPDQYRLLHNLSYPYDKNSINYNIPKKEATVQYERISDAVELIRKFGRKCYMAKSDIPEAFRLLTLNPDIYHLMRFTWEEMWYYDKSLPMGCSSSCRLFSAFTDKYGVEYVVKILDDFLFLSRSREQCEKCLDAFLDLCKKACIPVAAHKTVSPCWCLVFLRAEFDTEIMQLRLPLDKIQRYSCHVEEVLCHNRITIRDLQSIIGKLQYSTSVIHAGKAFLGRLINLTTGVKVPCHYIRLTKGAKLDLVVWKTFLEEFNGLSFLYEPSFAASHTIKMYSDASKKGFGSCYGSNWTQGSWPENWRNYHINILEMYPVMALIETFGHKF